MTDNILKVAVLGAGSIGCYLGGLLAKGGADVTFIGRARFQKQLSENGLTLTHYARQDIHIPAESFEFALAPMAAGNADIVLVCVKSQDSFKAAQSIIPYIKPEALVVSFQNGVTNVKALSQALPSHKILNAIVPFNVTGTGPGRFHCGTEGNLMIEASPDPRPSELSHIFARAGQRLEITPNIKGLQWGKLVVNLNNALNALSGGTLHESLSQRDYRRAFAAQMEEALGVVSGAGITAENFGKTSLETTAKIMRLPNFLFRQVMKRNIKIDKTARSSMLDDLEMGRGTEIDFLQGAIVKLAEKTGQSAPINSAVMAAVKDAFASGKSPKMTGKEIWQLCQQG